MPKTEEETKDGAETRLEEALCRHRSTGLDVSLIRFAKNQYLLLLVICLQESLSPPAFR